MPEAGVGIGIAVVVAVDCEVVLVAEEVPAGSLVVRTVVGSMLFVDRLLDGTAAQAEIVNRSSAVIIAVNSLIILSFPSPNRVSLQGDRIFQIENLEKREDAAAQR